MEGHAQIMFSVEFIPGAMEWEGGRLDGKNQECGRTHLDFLSGAEVEGREDRGQNYVQGSLSYRALF